MPRSKMKLHLAIAAVAVGAIGAGIGVGAMVWEPWSNGAPALADRIATCEREMTSSWEVWRDGCIRWAREDADKWECYIKYGFRAEAAWRECMGFRE